MEQLCNHCQRMAPSSSFSQYSTVCDDCVERERSATTKACIECGEVKPKSAFGPSGSAVDGHRKVCKECMQRQKAEALAAAPPRTTLADCLDTALQKYGPDAVVKSDYGRRAIVDEIRSIQTRAAGKLRVRASLVERAPDVAAPPGDVVATIHYGGHDGWHPRALISLPDALPPDAAAVRAQRRGWAQAILAAPDEWAILDTETTDKVDADVIEIALIDPTGRVLYTSLVRPTKSIHPEVVALTHIRDAQVASAPDFPTVYQRLRPFIESRRLLVYNAEFDILILKRQIEQQCGVRWEPVGVECLLLAYAEYRGDRHGAKSKFAGEYVHHPLEQACRQMGVATESQVHRALPDCRQSLALLRVMAV